MHELASFTLLTGAAALGAAIVLLRVQSAATAATLARGFLLVTAAMSVALVALTVAVASGAVPMRSIATAFRFLVFRGWIPVGVGLAGAAIALARDSGWLGRVARGGGARAFVESPRFLLALCLSASLAYVAVDIGKLTHDDEMRQFFRDSGLPVWMHYAVVAAELAGAIGLLVRRLVVPAAIGLGLLMVGAIATHARNGDPFSDSLEALHLLLVLACIAVIAPRGRARPSTGTGPD
jgi:hypothetical protein